MDSEGLSGWRILYLPWSQEHGMPGSGSLPHKSPLHDVMTKIDASGNGHSEHYNCQNAHTGALENNTLTDVGCHAGITL